MKKETIVELCNHRDHILSHLQSIKSILQQTPGCENEYYLANSHYIPQIITALLYDSKFLPRGQYCLENTLINLNDQLTTVDQNSKGIKKYLV